MTRKIALVGFAGSYREAPFDDTDVEIWGLNELWKYLPRWDRWFELHPREVFAHEGDRDQAAHLAWLQEQPADKPVYMLQRHDDIPGSTPYPLEEMTRRFFPGQSRGYFTSSIAFMLALAIAEGPSWIGIYGIDLASDQEYASQRPAAEYFVGLARGQGIEVHIASASALLKAGEIYGYDQQAQSGVSLAFLAGRIAELREKRDKLLSTLQSFDGALSETEYHYKIADAAARGVRLPTPGATGGAA